MLKTRRLLGTHWLGALLLLGALTSCNSKDIAYIYAPEGIAAQVNAIRVTMGTQNVTVFKDGKVTLGPLAFIRPNTNVTTELLDAQGNVMQTVSDQFVRVNMGPETGAFSTGLTYTRTGPFSGTFRANNAGTSSFVVTLFDTVERRNVFGPYAVALIIR